MGTRKKPLPENFFEGAAQWGVGRFDSSKPALVYVMSAGGRFCKIGVTRDLDTRLATTRTHCPLAVTLAYATEVLPRMVAAWIELRVRHQFVDRCSNGGEWFEVTAEEATAAVQAAEFFA